MKLSTYLRQFNRTIAYYPQLARLVGGATPALLLSQAIYWSDKGSDGEGWVYKRQEEWGEETGLTRTELENARAKLRECAVLHERRAHAPGTSAPVVWFQVDFAAIDTLWEQAQGGLDLRENRESICGKPANGNAGNPQNITITENTPETTSSSAAARALRVESPTDPLALTWNEHVGTKLTPAQLRDLQDWRERFALRGKDPGIVLEAIRYTARNSEFGKPFSYIQRFLPDWLEKGIPSPQGTAHSGPQSIAPATRRKYPECDCTDHITYWCTMDWMPEHLRGRAKLDCTPEEQDEGFAAFIRWSRYPSSGGVSTWQEVGAAG